MLDSLFEYIYIWKTRIKTLERTLYPGMKWSIREMIVEIIYYLVWLDVIWRNRINFFEKIFLWISNEG